MIAPWGWVALAYGGILAAAAVTARHVPRRGLLIAGCVAYALAGLAASAWVHVLWLQLVVPGALLLAGYWLSGPFYRDPQPWLEQRLLASDRWVLSTLGLDRSGIRIPRLLLNLLEVSYAAVYLVVGLAAAFVATYGVDALVGYWTPVLAAGLCCYVTLPWLRARPPRALEPAPHPAAGTSRVRRFNAALLHRASVQAATIPSGHVAVAVAASAAVLPVNPAAGSALLVLACLIAAAAFVGRYHYAFDCVSGAVVGGLVSLL